jgi:hypothetical protein
MGEHLLEAEQPLLVRRSLRLKRVIATALIISKICSFKICQINKACVHSAFYSLGVLTPKQISLFIVLLIN